MSELLKRIDKGESGTKLALEFGVRKVAISDRKKNRLQPLLVVQHFIRRK
jgi:hypothetical protein